MLNLNKIASTESEKAVVAYITAHPQEALAMSIRELADASFTSAASVVRFYKKLNYKRFDEFKVALATEAEGKTVLQNINQDFPEFSQVDPIQTAKLVSDIKRRAIRYTAKTIEKTDWKGIIRAINQASGISLCGIGFSRLPLYSLETNLRRIGYRVTYEPDESQLLNWISTCDKKELFILVSYSGVPLIKYAKALKSKGLKTIVVTNEEERHICSLADYCIRVAKTETDNAYNRVSHIASVTGCTYALEVLYSILFAERYEENRKKLDHGLVGTGEMLH